MTRKIELTRGFEAIIDDADFERVSQYKWRVSVGQWGAYAVTWMRIEGKGRHVYLHRFLLGFPADKLIGFANGNRLDCRRENLKITTASKSQASRRAVASNNRSGFKGVSLIKKSNKYKAYIRSGGVLIHLGVFTTAPAAAAAYNKKAAELHGEFAGLNNVW